MIAHVHEMLKTVQIKHLEDFTLYDTLFSMGFFMGVIIINAVFCGGDSASNRGDYRWFSWHFLHRNDCKLLMNK